MLDLVACVDGRKAVVVALEPDCTCGIVVEYVGASDYDDRGWLTSDEVTLQRQSDGRPEKA